MRFKPTNRWIAGGMAACCLLLPALLNAEEPPVIFSRGMVTIVPAPEPELSLEKTKTDTEKNKAAEKKTDAQKPSERPTRQSHSFNVTIRNYQSPMLQDAFTLEQYKDDSGVLIVLNKTTNTEVLSSNEMTPVDILFVAEDGTILQIVPSVVLANLTENIPSPAPIKAFLHLKGGIAKQLNVRPQDKVEHDLFKRKVQLLQ